jgi:putative ABC transport system ATP-binding protein
MNWRTRGVPPDGGSILRHSRRAAPPGHRQVGSGRDPQRVECRARGAISSGGSPDPPRLCWSTVIAAPRSAAPLAALDDVHLTLASAAGPVDILRGVSLEIAAGETVSLVGPSGSGKTSLIMVLSGIERPTSGRVSIDGRDLRALNEDALARLRRAAIGIVFQNFHLIPTMTVLENVAIPLELAGRRDALDHAGERLGAVGLGHCRGHYPAQLSGGEQQRVAIARALVAGPRLLLADEPTGNLDHASGQLVMDCLFEQQARLGATLLLITHDPALAERCGRGIRMLDGRIAEDRCAVPSGLGGRRRAL